ncbi:MAG TPA: hypothetical protein VIE66_04625 [Methylocella sp.]|jgi:hypothetical protein
MAIRIENRLRQELLKYLAELDAAFALTTDSGALICITEMALAVRKLLDGPPDGAGHPNPQARH